MNKDIKNSQRNDLKRKLTSRKFWMAIIGVITPLLVIFNVPDITIEKVVTLASSVSVAIAYIVGEGMTDISYKKNDKSEVQSDWQ